MTRIAELMGWCGTVERCPPGAAGRWFDFPRRVLCSVRFGTHDFVLDETMRIVPVRRDAPLKPNRRRRLQARRPPVDRPLFCVPEECRKNVRSWFSA